MSNIPYRHILVYSYRSFALYNYRGFAITSNLEVFKKGKQLFVYNAFYSLNDIKRTIDNSIQPIKINTDSEEFENGSREISDFEERVNNYFDEQLNDFANDY